MNDTPTRFPLAWPAGRPRRSSGQRTNGKFKKRGGDGWLNDITVAAAMDRLEAEVTRLGGVNTLLSSNLDVRLDGRPRSDRGNPSDPGVCLYFTLKGRPMAMACDAYYRVADNIAALAAHIEATRAISRYGVATAAETLRAFEALPPPADVKPKRPWWDVFGVQRDATDEETVKTLFRMKAKSAHPDTGGSAHAMAELNEALKEALADLVPA